MSAKNTPYTITDANGRPLCHAPSAIKRNLDSARKRAARERFEDMCREAGMVKPGGWWVCAETGIVARKNGEHRTGETNVIDMGHVIPDADGGPMCPCNLVPQVRSANLAAEADNNAPLIPATFVAGDPRVMWRSVWERTAKPSKVRRAV